MNVSNSCVLSVISVFELKGVSICSVVMTKKQVSTDLKNNKTYRDLLGRIQRGAITQEDFNTINDHILSNIKRQRTINLTQSHFGGSAIRRTNNQA